MLSHIKSALVSLPDTDPQNHLLIKWPLWIWIRNSEIRIRSDHWIITTSLRREEVSEACSLCI
jgi:hypothetical protein